MKRRTVLRSIAGLAVTTATASVAGGTETAVAAPAAKSPTPYVEGAFAGWLPTAQSVGQSVLLGPSRRLRVVPPGAGSAGWPAYGVFDRPATSELLCQPVGFAVLTGPAPALGGAGFSQTGAFGIALAVLQPHVPGYAGNVLFRFAAPSSPAAQPNDVEGFLTTPNATITPRLWLDPAERLAMVVDANRFGGHVANPGRARLLDLSRGARVLATFEFDGKTLSAAVVKTSSTEFEAIVTTNVETRRVRLPR